jgi:hypothetical protein
MKKIIYIIASLGLLWGCKSYNDQFEGAGDVNISLVKTIDYTLTDDDYASFDSLSNNYFSENYPATSYLPDFLAEKYPVLDAGSAVNITYYYYEDAPSYTAFTSPKTYTLTDADYATASLTIGNAKYFSPENDADDYLPSVLASSITEASVGDVYLVSYNYSDVEPDQVSSTTLLDEGFDSDLGNFTTYSVTGSQTWAWSSYSGEGYAKISGYSSGNKENEDWVVSPALDLTGYLSVILSVNQTAKYVNSNWNQLVVALSTDFDGSSNYSTATWTALTIPTLPSGSDYTFVESGNIDLSAYIGQTIYIGFHYYSTTSNAATWEVSNVKVTATTAQSQSSIVTDAVTIEKYYTYSSSGWKKTTGAYYLTSIDYDDMGTPGTYNNFSSSVLPENYLPQFLTSNYPYAQEEDTLVVVYKYYSNSATSKKAEKYSYSGGIWTAYDPVTAVTEQYLKSSTGIWAFDPTVNYTMVSADYQIIVDYVKANISSDYINSYGTGETYYGADAYYIDFATSSGNFASTFSTWQDAVKEAIGTALLPAKYPNAVTQVNGIDVYYVVTFATYNGSNATYSITFQCTQSGTSPVFTYIEDSITPI